MRRSSAERPTGSSLRCVGVWLLVALTSTLVSAQTPLEPPKDTAPLLPGTFRLTTPGEVPLSEFVDFVSKRLNIRIVYDDVVRQRKLNLVAPDPISVETLWAILQSVLINEGLVVTEDDQQGFRRITTNDKIPQVARPSVDTEDLAGIDAAVPLTRVFILREAVPSKISELIQPFLSTPGATVIPLDQRRLLIVIDVVRNVRRIEQLIDILDGEQTQIEIEFIPAKNVAVEDLADQLRELLSARRKALGSVETETGGVEVTVDLRTNSLILIGTKADIERTSKLLEQLDKTLKSDQRTFTLRYFSAQRLDDLIRESIASQPIKPPYQSQVEGNLLIVDSTPEVLELVARLHRQLDTREAPESQSPIRYYRIKNVPAEELVATIQGIGGNVTQTPGRRGVTPRQRTTNDRAVPGPNASPLDYPGIAQPIQEPLRPPAMRQEGETSQRNILTDEERLLAENDLLRLERQQGFLEGFPEDFADDRQRSEDPISNLIAAAIVTVDVNSNTIIVVAPPEVQRIYADLIEKLDQRRPQVLIEAQVVVIDTSDDYSLGVEVSGGDRTGAKRLFSFSSYGLSAVNAATGALSIIPGTGFNGTLVDPTTADVVVRALAAHRRAKVLSTPRILVNDNAEGQLTSVLEVPFTSVNASQTVATTSFAGFAEAGSTITVTPTISDDNFLQLDYVVTLNSFTGTGSAGVPPPRQTNEVSSRVTIPDGYTVIVGGLTSKNGAYEITSMPWIERIPIVRDLLSLQTNSLSQTSLFVFLKPIILREDKFKDLRFLSDIELRKAERPANFPENQPLLIE